MRFAATNWRATDRERGHHIPAEGTDPARAVSPLFAAEPDQSRGQLRKEIADMEQRLRASRQYLGQPKEQLEVEFSGADDLS